MPPDPPRTLCIIRAENKNPHAARPHQNHSMCAPTFFNLWIRPCVQCQLLSTNCTCLHISVQEQHRSLVLAPNEINASPSQIRCICPLSCKQTKQNRLADYTMHWPELNAIQFTTHSLKLQDICMKFSHILLSDNWYPSIISTVHYLYAHIGFQQTMHLTLQLWSDSGGYTTSVMLLMLKFLQRCYCFLCWLVYWWRKMCAKVHKLCCLSLNQVETVSWSHSTIWPSKNIVSHSTNNTPL